MAGIAMRPARAGARPSALGGRGASSPCAPSTHAPVLPLIRRAGRVCRIAGIGGFSRLWHTPHGDRPVQKLRAAGDAERQASSGGGGGDSGGGGDHRRVGEDPGDGGGAGGPLPIRAVLLLAGFATVLDWMASRARAVADAGSEGKGGKSGGAANWNPFSGPQATGGEEDPDGLEESTDTDIIKRLLRDAFAGILGNKERLEALERGGKLKSGSGADQLRVHGEVGIGLGIGLQGAEGAVSPVALDTAGLFGGLELLLHCEAVLNPKKGDTLMVDLLARGDPDRPDCLRSVAVSKVQYKVSPAEDTEVLVAPCGGQWRDAAPNLNPVDGLGLTRVAAGGCPLFFQCRGAMAAATRRLLGGVLELHAGHILGANGKGGATVGHTVGQVTARPHERAAAALFAAHGSGELVGGKGGLGSLALGLVEQLRPGGEYGGGGFDSPLEGSTVLGATGVVGLMEGLTVSGWAAMDSRGGPLAWSALVSSPPDGEGRAWGSSLSSTRDGASCGAPGRGGAEAGPGVQWEAFVRLPAGEGLVVTPGLLYHGAGGVGATVLALRSQWTF